MKGRTSQQRPVQGAARPLARERIAYRDPRAGQQTRAHCLGSAVLVDDVQCTERPSAHCCNQHEQLLTAPAFHIALSDRLNAIGRCDDATRVAVQDGAAYEHTAAHAFCRDGNDKWGAGIDENIWRLVQITPMISRLGAVSVPMYLCVSVRFHNRSYDVPDYFDRSGPPIYRNRHRIRPQPGVRILRG